MTIAKKYPVGTLVQGVVREKRPFGIFLDLNDNAANGFVSITDIHQDKRKKINELDFPDIGVLVVGRVLGHRISSNQVVISLRDAVTETGNGSD